MTRVRTEGTAAGAVAQQGQMADLPEPMSWPAAAGIILGVSLLLWLVIGLAVSWLIG